MLEKYKHQLLLCLIGLELPKIVASAVLCPVLMQEKILNTLKT